MSLQQRLDYERMNYELNYIWTSALNESIVARMDAKHAGFHKISDNLMPIEYQLEERRMRRQMITDSVAHLSNVSLETFSGLVVDLARDLVRDHPDRVGSDRIVERIAPEIVPPAPGQGCLRFPSEGS